MVVNCVLTAFHTCAVPNTIRRGCWLATAPRIGAICSAGAGRVRTVSAIFEHSGAHLNSPSLFVTNDDQ